MSSLNLSKKMDKEFIILHLAVESISDRIVQLQENGIAMVDQHPRKGGGGAEIAFIHPTSSGSVLIELCEKKEMGHGKNGYLR